MDNELLLVDRLGVIRDTINKYGQVNFYISFSGGKDSTVVSRLVDMALPGNTIPRVFINTGIEYTKIVEFVHKRMAEDERFIELKPSKSIKEILEKYGYPFKSKDHSTKLELYQHGSNSYSLNRYLTDKGSRFSCPEKLKYQFTKDYPLKVSPQCCHKLKKEAAHKYEKESGRTITITGMQKEEGGERTTLSCIVTRKGKTVKFHPLAVVSGDWENWLIERERDALRIVLSTIQFQKNGLQRLSI